MVSSLGDLAVSFERFIVLEGGEQDSSETLTIKGLNARLNEAKAGLRSGKKVSKAHVRLGRGSEEWSLTLYGATFDVSGLKIKHVMGSREEEDGDLSLEASVIDKAAMIEHAVETVDLLFGEFLRIRLDDAAWQQEKMRIKEWALRE